MTSQKDIIDWAMVIFIILAIVSIISVIIALPGFYKLGPNTAAVETSRITGDISQPIIYNEEGGKKNIHWRFWLITSLKKHETKIRTMEIKEFGEQKEGSLNIVENEGLDYNQFPNRLVIAYRINPENLRNFHILISEETILKEYHGDYIEEGNRYLPLQKLIEGSVYTLLTESNLNKETLQIVMDDKCQGNRIVEIISVDYTQKITE